MKKFFMMAVMAVAALTANAQAEEGTVTITPKVGINIASTNEDETKSKIGLVAGAEAAYQLPSNIAVSGGLFYSMEGSKAKEGEGKTNLSCLNIPILANYYVAKGFAIKAGVQPSILLSAKEEYGSKSMDIKEHCNSFGLDIPVGVSYEISNFVIDARYNIGVTKLNKESNGDKNWKKNSIMLAVGYKF